MLRARRGEVLRLRSTARAQYQLLGLSRAGELLLGLLEGREGGRAEGAAVGGRLSLRCLVGGLCLCVTPSFFILPSDEPCLALDDAFYAGFSFLVPYR